MSRPLIDFCQLSKSYGSNNEHPVVANFNLSIQKGEFVCIIGHSGCGKSTVLSIAMGLNKATKGAFVLDGKETDEPGIDRGVVFQHSALLPWLTARENVILAIGQVNGRHTQKEQGYLAEQYLNRVGLHNLAECYPNELSAGMRQRVGIARAFALEPKVLLLDEPFSLLDALTRMELQDELMRLWEQNHRTVIMVTHDVDEALFLADRIVMMTSGPSATIGNILSINFPRPRFREQVLAHPDYYRLRDELVGFLEGQTTPVIETPPELIPTPYDMKPESMTGRVIMVPLVRP